MNDEYARRFEEASKDVDENFRRTSIDRMIESIQMALNVLRKQKAFIEGKGVREAVGEYLEETRNIEYVTEMHHGSFKAIRCVEPFIKNPDLFLQKYNETPDKSMFYDYEKDPGNDLNELLTVGMMRNIIFVILRSQNAVGQQAAFETIPDDRKRKLVQEIGRQVHDLGNKTRKKSIIKNLVDIVKKIDSIDGLESNRKLYNKRMEEIGLKPLCIKPDCPTIKDDRYLYGTDLEDYTAFQLEGMMAFYINRLEKIRERVLEGFYALVWILDEFKQEEIKGVSIEKFVDEYANNQERYRLTIDYGKGKGTHVKSVDEDVVRACWINYHLIANLLSDMPADEREKIMQIPAEEIRDPEVLTERVYELLFKHYEEMYAQKFQSDINGYKVASIFTFNAGGILRDLHYSHKRNFVEDLIVQAQEQKINWGIIPNENEEFFTRMMVIGFDIPGLNMPVRLHFPKSDVIEMMCANIGEDGIDDQRDVYAPAYIGNRDFFIDGKNFGTQVLLLINPTESNFIKKAAKDKNLPKRVSKMVKHMACTQLPNPIKKLTNGEQVTPDYVGMRKRKILRARRLKNNSVGDDKRE